MKKYKEIAIEPNNLINTQISLSRLLDMRITDVHCYITELDDKDCVMYIRPVAIEFEDGTKVDISDEGDCAILEYSKHKRLKTIIKQPMLRRVLKEGNRY